MLQPKVYAIILVIFFSPIIILGICLYCCCCANSQQRAQLPASTKVSPEIMSKCADCCICFQPFWVDDEVAVLPCSDMHVFHYSCMEGWSKVKPNCPICRHLLLWFIFSWLLWHHQILNWLTFEKYCCSLWLYLYPTSFYLACLYWLLAYKG